MKDRQVAEVGIRDFEAGNLTLEEDTCLLLVEGILREAENLLVGDIPPVVDNHWDFVGQDTGYFDLAVEILLDLDT